jgi:hypothetical protein
MVDSDKAGKISQSEFQAGCGKGWIQQPDAATVNDMKSALGAFATVDTEDRDGKWFVPARL